MSRRRQRLFEGLVHHLPSPQWCIRTGGDDHVFAAKVWDDLSGVVMSQWDVHYKSKFIGINTWVIFDIPELWQITATNHYKLGCTFTKGPFFSIFSWGANQETPAGIDPSTLTQRKAQKPRSNEDFGNRKNCIMCFFLFFLKSPTQSKCTNLSRDATLTNMAQRVT